MSFFKTYGKQAMLSDVFKSNWNKAGYLIGLAEEVCLGDSEWTRGELEIIEAYCSQLNQCTYCYELHNQTAAEYGESDLLVNALIEDIDSSSTNTRIKAIAHYLKTLVLEPAKMTQADVDKVLNSGTSEAGLGDAIFLCGLSAMLNRIVFGFGIDGDTSQFKVVAEGIKAGGYRPMYSDLGVPEFKK